MSMPGKNFSGARHLLVGLVAGFTMLGASGYAAPAPNLTVTVNRSDLNGVMMGVTTFDALIAAGESPRGFTLLRRHTNQ